MLKKLSLIFIRYVPLILALNILLRLVLRFCTISTLIVYCVDVITQIVITIGFIILSFTFKFCIYHRILLYYVLVCYLIHLYDYIIRIDMLLSVLIYFFVLVIIMQTFITIYIYLRQKHKGIK